MVAPAVLFSLTRCAIFRLCSRESVFFRWTRCLSLTVRRCHATDIPASSLDHLSCGLERYKDLQMYFRRRLKATHHRFFNIPDPSVVRGRHHVYFVDGGSIRRIDERQNEPGLVLELGRLSEDEEEETEPEKEERKQRSQWTVQRIRLSPQEKHLAVTLKTVHKDDLRCVVVRLGKRNASPLDPPHVVLTLDNVFSFEWATDDVLFYTILEGLRCSGVYRLDLTSRGGTITSVYEETQPDVFVEVALSRDRHMLTINCNSRTSSEVLLVDTTASNLAPILVQPRQLGLLYHVEHWRSWLLLLANTGPRQEYQVLQAPLSEPSMGSWQPLFSPSPGTVLKDMDVVGDHCVLSARTPANELELIVIPLTQPKEVHTLQLPSWASTIATKSPGLADQYNILEFLISSPVHPPEPYCLFPKEGLLLSGTGDRASPKNQGSCITTRLEACSKDGTSVPVTLFHAAPVECLKQAPLLVHVYGAYGRDVNMEFCPDRRLLLEQGWALAYCHIRGGGERGLSWHRQAAVEGKLRGVEDLQACLHHLFSSDVSSPSLTVLTACSAGAVPVGALCNRHPCMMRAVTLQSPFLDVLETMENPKLPLTLEDREEWGDPVENSEHRHTIASYCPLHNITPQRYPSMLLTASRDDSRVPLAGVLKYTGQLKKATHTHFTMRPTTEHEPAPNIVLNIRPGADHLGPGDFHMMLEEEALQLAFLYTELGLDPPRPPRRRKR
ncbi:prolyl endopeptidase-like [Aulostomus maculatus]